MLYRINANTLAQKRYLQIDDKGVVYADIVFLSGARRFRFDQVDCILLSANQELSFQVGNEVFTLPVNLFNTRHMETINAFVTRVHQANGFGVVNDPVPGRFRP